MDLEYGLGFAMEEGLALVLDLIEERKWRVAAAAAAAAGKVLDCGLWVEWRKREKRRSQNRNRFPWMEIGGRTPGSRLFTRYVHVFPANLCYCFFHIYIYIYSIFFIFIFSFCEFFHSFTQKMLKKITQNFKFGIVTR